MREAKDRGSKWLIQHCGDVVLRLASISGFRSWRAAHAELVQPKKIPDGLLEVFFDDDPKPAPFVVEIATYAQRSNAEQALLDAMLVRLDRGVWPDVITVVLKQKGNFRLSGAAEEESRRATSRFSFSWRVVELWTLRAEDLLATNEVGVIPWVPLTQFDGNPHDLIQTCRERIDRQAPPREHDILLALTEIMTRLAYNDKTLTALLRASKAMIDINEMYWDDVKEEQSRRLIERFVAARFAAPIPGDVRSALEKVENLPQLEELTDFAATCADIEAFRRKLLSLPVAQSN